MRIAKLIDGPCKGQVMYTDVDSFPDTVRAYEGVNHFVDMTRESKAMPDINVPIHVYHFKGWVNAGVAEYSIEVQKK